MTSSDDRRRPRVAGQRRRHGRPTDGVESTEGAGTPLEPPTRRIPPPPVVAQRPIREEPAVEDPAVEDAAVEETGTDDVRPLTLRDLRVPFVVLVVAVLACAAVAVLALRDHDARDRDARAATAAATASLERLLSYDHRTIAAQAEENSALLTGQFRTEYASTMARTIAPLAEKEKTVVQARSLVAGVMGQTPDTVTVEVFVDQAKTSEGDDEPSVDQNRVIATMQRVGDRWLIAKLSAF